MAFRIALTLHYNYVQRAIVKQINKLQVWQTSEEHSNSEFYK